jgi:integrase
MAFGRKGTEHPSKSGIIISEKTNPSGGTSWRVEISARRTGGSREQKQFATLASAKEHAERRWEEILAVGQAAFLLTGEQRFDAVNALRALEPTGLTLVQAAEIALKHSPLGKRMTLEQLRTDFLSAPGKRLGKLVRRRSRTLETLTARTAAIVRTFGPSRLACEITPAEISRWLEKRDDWSPLTRNSYRLAAHAMFNYAVAHGHIGTNPVAQVPAYAVVSSPPSILSVDEAESLLVAAADTNHRHDLLGYVVLGLFGGLRRAELERLTWKAIKWDRRMITVDATAAKMASIRNVPLPQNAMAWLRKCDPKDRPLSPLGFRRRFDSLRAEAGIDRWSGNELRHSFASYHYDLHQNASLTAACLGHTSGTNLLFTHYRSLVALGDGARYFALTPKNEGMTVGQHPADTPPSSPAKVA